MGLGNRLKCLVSFLRYYDNPRHINLIWPNTSWVPDRFHELFDFASDTKIQEYDSLSPELIPEPEFPASWRLYVAPSDVIDDDIQNDDPFDADTRRIDLLYNKTPKAMIKTYKPYFAKLRPVANIQKIIDRTKIDDKCIAVQIRDNSDWKQHGRTSYVDLFITEMKKYPRDTKFFISVMDKDISNKIKSIFPNQIIEVKNKDYTSMKYAVADMFLLGIPNRALCSCGSTFYEVAWWLGGCKTKVKVIGTYENWEKFRPLSFRYKIFSIREDRFKQYKRITILGIKITFKIKKKQYNKSLL